MVNQRGAGGRCISQRSGAKKSAGRKIRDAEGLFIARDGSLSFENRDVDLESGTP
jgi:hypothetical protein